MGRPNDVAAAIVGDGGELKVVTGRGEVLEYDPAKNEKGPQSFAAAFTRGDKLYVVDSGDVPWTFDPADGSWTKGVKLEAAEDQKDEAWKASGNVSSKAPPEPADDE